MLGDMDTIEVPVKLYSVSQALVFLKDNFELEISDTWLRTLMQRSDLKLYRVGRSDFVTETDLYKLSLLPKQKPGPKKARRSQL